MPPTSGTKVARKGRITPLQDQGAMLSATGLTPSEISRALECSRVTVHQWMRKPWWNERRDYWLVRNTERLEPVLAGLKSKALTIHDLALDQLRDALLSTIGDSTFPNYPVRLKAIDMALNHALVQALVGAGHTAEHATAAAAAVVNLHVDEDFIERLALRRSQLADIDVEAVEIEDEE